MPEDQDQSQTDIERRSAIKTGLGLLAALAVGGVSGALYESYKNSLRTCPSTTTQDEISNAEYLAFLNDTIFESAPKNLELYKTVETNYFRRDAEHLKGENIAFGDHGASPDGLPDIPMNIEMDTYYKNPKERGYLEFTVNHGLSERYVDNFTSSLRNRGWEQESVEDKNGGKVVRWTRFSYVNNAEWFSSFNLFYNNDKASITIYSRSGEYEGDSKFTNQESLEMSVIGCLFLLQCQANAL